MRIMLLIFLASLCAGCAQTRQVEKRPLYGEGELYLYSEPFPQAATRLQFRIETVAAIREDGVTMPLTTAFNEFATSELGRQRLFAEGILPAGRYTGLVFKVKNATLMGEEGPGRLLVPEKPHEIKCDFLVRSGKATIVSLTLNYRDALTNSVSFQPSFSSQVPPVPLINLTGYVTNQGSNTISVFDRRSARIGKIIETGRGPTGIALDQLRLRAYVALSGDDLVGVIDVRENDIIDQIRLYPGDNPHFLALTPDGKLAVTANTGSNTASIVDVLSLIEVARIPVGNGPEYVLMDRTGRRAFVFNRLSSSISVIDMTTRQVAGTLATESGPLYGQLNRRGDRLYVYHDMSPNILVLPLDSQGIPRRINVGSGISALKVNPASDQVYVGKNFGGTIDIYDPFTLTVGDFLSAEGGIGYLTIDGEENNLLVVHPRNRLIRFINIISKRERGLIDTGLAPYATAVFGER